MSSGFQGFTILNNWSIGTRAWSATSADGSAQDLAAEAGLAATGLDEWLLPTGDGRQAARALKQYRSIGVAVDENLAANLAWYFRTLVGGQGLAPQVNASYAVAVPEPQMLAPALLALGATVVARRRRPG